MFPVCKNIDMERVGNKMYLVTTTSSAWGIRCNKIRKNCIPPRDILTLLTGRRGVSVVVGKYIGKVKPESNLCIFKLADFSSISPLRPQFIVEQPVEQPSLFSDIRGFREDMGRIIRNMFQRYLGEEITGRSINNIDVDVNINE